MLAVGSVLMQNKQLGSAVWGARNLWSEQPLTPPAEDVIAGLEFLINLPMWSLVGQQDEEKVPYQKFRQSIAKGRRYSVFHKMLKMIFPKPFINTSLNSLQESHFDFPFLFLSQSQHAENNSRRRRAHYLIMSITSIFFASWLPLNLFSLLMEVRQKTFCNSPKLVQLFYVSFFQVCPYFIRPYIEGYETVIYSLLQLCGLCNACINPVLYGYLNENFRKEYKNIYRWVRSQFYLKHNTYRYLLYLCL